MKTEGVRCTPTQPKAESNESRKLGLSGNMRILYSQPKGVAETQVKRTVHLLSVDRQNEAANAIDSSVAGQLRRYATEECRSPEG